MDKLYECYVRTYFSEMSMHFKELNLTPTSKRAAKHTSKPYWSETLTVLWRLYHASEKVFVKTDKRGIGR